MYEDLQETGQMLRELESTLPTQAPVAISNQELLSSVIPQLLL